MPPHLVHRHNDRHGRVAKSAQCGREGEAGREDGGFVSLPPVAATAGGVRCGKAAARGRRGSVVRGRLVKEEERERKL